MNVSNRFGVMLAQKQAREKRKIPMLEVSQKTGVTRKTLYEWERNTVTRFNAQVIIALCDYFDCDIKDLIVLDKSPEA